MEPMDLLDLASPITNTLLSVSSLNECLLLALTHDRIQSSVVLIVSVIRRQLFRGLAEHRSGRTTATQRW
jgi:hypothetical protein